MRGDIKACDDARLVTTMDVDKMQSLATRHLRLKHGLPVDSNRLSAHHHGDSTPIWRDREI